MNSIDNADTIIAVDIAKSTLDVRSVDQHFEVSNTGNGFAKILRKHKGHHNLLIVCEATGGYERKLICYMHEHQIGVVLINPARLRAFAKSEGVKAKSDPIDSQMIWQFAHEKKLRKLSPPDPVRENMAALMDRRAQLKKQISSEKNRLDKAQIQIMDSIERMICVIENEIDHIEDQLRECVDSCPLCSAIFEILTEIKGVGDNTAWAVLAYLDELGKLKRNQIAALAGLAPYVQDSGQYKGIRKIEGGRAKLRNALYMAAHSACTHNDVISKYASALKLRGKPRKYIVTAAMRKMLIHMHFLTKTTTNHLHEDTVATHGINTKKIVGVESSPDGLALINQPLQSSRNFP